MAETTLTAIIKPLDDCTLLGDASVRSLIKRNGAKKMDVRGRSEVNISPSTMSGPTTPSIELRRLRITTV